MKKNNSFIIFNLLFVGLGFGQNLVPNFSFEEYTNCPNSGDQIQYAIGWNKCSNVVSTPDYYNACSSENEIGVPQSLYLYQSDPRNCGAYSGLGIWSYTENNDREQIGINLTV